MNIHKKDPETAGRSDTLFVTNRWLFSTTQVIHYHGLTDTEATHKNFHIYHKLFSTGSEEESTKHSQLGAPLLMG